MISGHNKNSLFRESWRFFRRMHFLGFDPNENFWEYSFSLYCFASSCAGLEELETGKGLQGWVIKCAAGDVFVGTAIIDLYAKCGHMNEALKEFSRMPNCDVVSWTTMISGFVKMDDSITALKFFKEMRNTRVEINNYTVTTIITACAKPAMINEAIQIHSWILKSGFYMDSVVGAALINMYSKIGAIDLAETVFKDVEHIQNPGTWAVMISSFAQNQGSQRTIELFQRMSGEGLRPDTFCSSSFVSVIDCSSLGRQIHSYTLKTGLLFDLSFSSSLFTMYSKCGSLEDSFKVFEQIPVKDNVSWASMIAGFAKHGCADQAIQLFSEILSEVLDSLQKGKEIHGSALRAEIGKVTLVGSAFVTM